MPYYSQEILHKKSEKSEKILQILKVLRVKSFLPFRCAGLASIFHLPPNSEALGARSKLTIGCDSQSLQVVEALQAPLASVVDPLLLLLLTVERLSVLFSRELSPLFPQKFLNIVRVPTQHTALNTLYSEWTCPNTLLASTLITSNDSKVKC